MNALLVELVADDLKKALKQRDEHKRLAEEQQRKLKTDIAIKQAMRRKHGSNNNRHTKR